MGSLQAMEFASAVGRGEIGLRHALHWHLRSNHFPPHDVRMIDVALRAIKYGKREDWEHKLRLFEGVTFRGRKMVTVAEAIESLHLEAYLVPQDDA